MGSLPPSGFPVARVRRGPPSAVPLLATLLVVVLLLSAFSFVLLDLGAPRPDDGDDGDDTEPPPGSVRFINDDTTWQGLDLALRGPVLINPGSTLTLDGCNVTVDLEDLVLWGQGAFQVQSGAGLVLLRSRLSVKVDQNLTNAYATSSSWRGWGSIPPTASRIVNLMHASRPVLALNASLRQADTDLLVMGQSSPEGRMRLLAELPMREGVWERFEVDLSPISGGVARVAVLPLDLGGGTLFLNDARVLDGGEAPPGEAFDTGDLEKDGWNHYGYERYIQMGYGSFTPRVPELVEGVGAVRIVDSTVQADDGVPRRIDAHDDDFDGDPGEELELSLFHHARIGAHIEVSWGGDLDVTTSRFVNVPIRAEGAVVAVDGTSLEGDADLLTMDRCQAGLGSSSLVRRPPGGGEPTPYGDDRARNWALCAEGGGPVSLVGCDLEGGAVCLYLDGPSAVVDRCAFANASFACVWANGATGLGGWPQLEGTSTFAPMERDGPWDRLYDYIETRDCAIRCVYDDGARNREVRINCELTDATGELQNMPLLWDDGVPSELMMPSLLVRDDLSEVRVTNVTVKAEYYVDGTHLTRSVVIEQGTTEVVVRFDRDDLERALDPASVAREDGSLDIRARPGTEAGDLLLNTTIYHYDWEGWSLGTVQEPLLRYLIDGLVVEELDVDEVGMPLYLGMPQYYGTYVCSTLEVPMGPHGIEVQLLARVRDWGGREVLLNQTLDVLRVNGSTPRGEVERSLGFYMDLLLDPATDLVLGGLPSWDGGAGYSFRWLEAYLWPGSSLTVEDPDGPEDAYSYYYLEAYGPGELTLSGWDASMFELTAKGPLVRLVGSNIWYMSANLGDAVLRVEGSTFDEGFSVLGSGNASVEATGCTFLSVTNGGIDLGIYDIDRLTMRDCAMTSDTPGVAFGAVLSSGDVELEGCQLQGTSLLILPELGPPPGAAGIQLHNCTFAGEGSYLLVAGLANGTVHSEDVALDVSGNTFAGPGTGAVLASGLLGGFHDNAMGRGSGLLLFHPYRVGPSEDDWYSPDHVDVLGAGPGPAFGELLESCGLFRSYSYEEWSTVYDLVEGEADFAYDGRALTFLYDGGGGVESITEAIIVGDAVIIPLPEWSSIEGAVYTLYRELTEEGDWWDPS